MQSNDLFGNDSNVPAGALRPVPATSQSTLFAAAAERIAMTNTKPVSQIRVELLHGLPAAAGSGWRCERDHAMRSRKGQLYCPVCDA